MPRILACKVLRPCHYVAICLPTDHIAQYKLRSPLQQGCSVLSCISDHIHSQAYPSLKPLAAWMSDLVTRIDFISNWIDRGIPSVFWISGFFFPQAFLTGTLQNFARRAVVSIDTITFDFKVCLVVLYPPLQLRNYQSIWPTSEKISSGHRW